jgi:uncharacterized small protein (DUF1192 family)
MDEEERQTRVLQQYKIGQDLSEFSVEELELTCKALEQEMERLRGAIVEKSNHLDAAASLFKS